MVQASYTNSTVVSDITENQKLQSSPARKIALGPAVYSGYITGVTGASVTIIAPAEFAGGRIFYVNCITLGGNAARDHFIADKASAPTQLADSSQVIVAYDRIGSAGTVNIQCGEAPVTRGLYYLPDNSGNAMFYNVVGRWG